MDGEGGERHSWDLDGGRWWAKNMPCVAGRWFRTQPSTATVNPQERQRVWWLSTQGLQIHKEKKVIRMGGRICARLRQEMLYLGSQDGKDDMSHCGVSRPRDHLSGNCGTLPQAARMSCSYCCCQACCESFYMATGPFPRPRKKGTWWWKFKKQSVGFIVPDLIILFDKDL